MRRIVPYPLLAASLFVMWVLLTQSTSGVYLLMGAVFALVGTQAAAALRPEHDRIRSVRAALKLAVIVLVDIIRSNIAVARIVLTMPKHRVSTFVRLPLDMRNRHGLTILALIITATPGTIWVQYDRGRSSLIVHVLDMVDEEAWIQLIKHRYESLLMEIFGR